MHISEAEGSVPEWLTVPDAARGEVIYMYPQFLSGGTELLFTVRTTDDSWRPAILSLEAYRLLLLGIPRPIVRSRAIPLGESHRLHDQEGQVRRAGGP